MVEKASFHSFVAVLRSHVLVLIRSIVGGIVGSIIGSIVGNIVSSRRG